MSKKKKKIRTEKKSNKPKAEPENVMEAPLICRHTSQIRTILMRIAENSRYVGALEKMLSGCIACLVVVSILFMVPGLGRFYEKSVFALFSFIPKNFIPPGVYLPGLMMIVIFLAIIAGYTISGYRKGSEPFEFKEESELVQDNEQKSLKEKIAYFVITLAIVLVVIYFRHTSEYPDQTLFEAIQHPVFIVFLITMTIGVSFWSFTDQKNSAYVMFVLYSGLAVAFTLFLTGLLISFVIELFLHIINL